MLGLSVLLFGVWLWRGSRDAENAARYAAVLQDMIPESYPAVPETRGNNVMPSLCIDGENFSALLSFPAFDAVFPVGDSWDTSLPYPRRWTGSIYDGSLIVGATNRSGQLDFVREINVGDAIWITDMTGARYVCTATDIRYRDSADRDALLGFDGDLILFVKNIYSFEYVIIQCAFAGT